MSNLVTRALSGTVFVLVMVGCILWGERAFGTLFAVLTVIVLAEFYQLVNHNQLATVNQTVGNLAGLYFFIATFYYVSQPVGARIFLPYLLSLLYILVSELYLQHSRPMANWAYTFAGQLYITLPFALLNLLAFYGDAYSPLLPLAVFVFLWANDTGAYCFGSLLHRRFPAKLFERISPNKSWIGSAGGALTVVLAAVLFSAHSTQLTALQWVGLGLVVVVFGTWGDLVESLLKRQLGLKDSGHFLPGHGGALDRFDSALLAIPASVIYLYFL